MILVSVFLFDENLMMLTGKKIEFINNLVIRFGLI
jgi:hypothetical protein